MRNPFRYFNSSPEVIWLAVVLYIRYPLSLRQVEDLLFERGIDICHETSRYLWNRFGPMFAAEIRKRRIHHRSYSRWRWHLDEAFIRINGETYYLWRAVDHEGQVLAVASSITALRHDQAITPRPIFHADEPAGPCSSSNPYAGRQRVALLYLRYFNRLASSSGGFPHVTWPGHHVAIIGSLFNCRHGRDPIAFRRWTRTSAM
jgi:hypothetical protein